MTVAELIKELQEADPDLKVMVQRVYCSGYSCFEEAAGVTTAHMEPSYTQYEWQFSIERKNGVEILILE